MIEKTKKKKIVGFVFLLVFAIIYYLYYDNISSSKCILYYFYRPGCGYCDMFNPIWFELTSIVSDKIQCKKINTADAVNRKLTDNFNIDGVPTLIKVYPNGIRSTFVGDRNIDSIKVWLL